jgi:hypothetical protein
MCVVRDCQGTSNWIGLCFPLKEVGESTNRAILELRGRTFEIEILGQLEDIYSCRIHLFQFAEKRLVGLR